MSIMSIIAGAIVAQAPVPAPDVAYWHLARGLNEAAIERIEANGDLAADDPARLINLGIAHAREGRADEARALFRAALRDAESVRLETATGDWRDSRTLARIALRMLDDGEFGSGVRLAAR